MFRDLKPQLRSKALNQNVYLTSILVYKHNNRHTQYSVNKSCAWRVVSRLQTVHMWYIYQ